MLLLHNASQIVTVDTQGAGLKRGAAMREIGVVERASVVVQGENIVGVIPAADARPRAGDTVIDCTNKVIFPGFVDSHTHAVFAGVRADEFAMRIEGKTYAEIAAAGGGINHSVNHVRAASMDDLVRLSQPHIEDALRHGTTTMEIKSGYGLDTENEIKLLEAARAITGDAVPFIHTTFLGAHAVPPEFRGHQSEYVDLVIHDMLPAIAQRGLAEFIDVFCDVGYFTNDETERICTAGKILGLRAKIHVDELGDTGGAAMAARIGALSADHLECVNDHGIAALAHSATVAVCLPGTAYFLGIPYPPARRMIDAGCVVALATDFNPGSTPTYNMQLVLSMACTQTKMTIEEAIAAATINGAAALGISDRTGSIEPGKRADLLVCDIRDYREIAYWFGGNAVSSVVRGGELVP